MTVATVITHNACIAVITCFLTHLGSIHARQRTLPRAAGHCLALFCVAGRGMNATWLKSNWLCVLYTTCWHRLPFGGASRRWRRWWSVKRTTTEIDWAMQNTHNTVKQRVQSSLQHASPLPELKCHMRSYTVLTATRQRWYSCIYTSVS